MDPTLTSLLLFLLIGVIAGWIAGKLVRGGGFGLVGDLVVGVIGTWSETPGIGDDRRIAGAMRLSAAG